MSPAGDEFTVRRIVLALDPLSDARTALAEASQLAARLRAELSAVFVEDEDLLRSAALPFVRRIGARGAQEFGAAETEREMRALAAELRRMVEERSRALNVASRFAVVRGRIEQAVLEAAEEGDLVVVTGAPRARSTGESAVRYGRRPILVLRPGESLDVPVTVAYDGSPSARRTLAAARSLAGDNPIHVLLIAADRDAAKRLEPEARDALAGGDADFRPMAEPDIRSVCSIAQAPRRGVLVLPADSPLIADRDGALALDRARCPVLLVR